MPLPVSDGRSLTSGKNQILGVVTRAAARLCTGLSKQLFVLIDSVLKAEDLRDRGARPTELFASLDHIADRQRECERVSLAHDASHAGHAYRLACTRDVADHDRRSREHCFHLDQPEALG